MTDGYFLPYTCTTRTEYSMYQIKRIKDAINKYSQTNKITEQYENYFFTHLHVHVYSYHILTTIKNWMYCNDHRETMLVKTWCWIRDFTLWLYFTVLCTFCEFINIGVIIFGIWSLFNGFGGSCSWCCWIHHICPYCVLDSFL